MIFLNITVNLTSFFDTILSGAGKYFAYISIFIYFLIITLPVYYMYKIPPIIKICYEEIDNNELKTIQTLKNRLSQNPVIKSQNIDKNSEDYIKKCLIILDKEADEIILKRAQIIFISTAVSQNGKLDGLIVLFQQIFLIYEIAKLYYGRPSFLNLLMLYKNVAISAFIAKSIEEIDFAGYIEPLIDEMLIGSAISAIPGLSKISGLVLNSLINGASNSFITLIVGNVTKTYCNPVINVPDKIRKKASIQALKQIPSIIKKSSKTIFESLNQMLKKKENSIKNIIKKLFENND